MERNWCSRIIQVQTIPYIEPPVGDEISHKSLSNKIIMARAPELLQTEAIHYVCADRHGEIVDNLKSKERIFTLHRPKAPGYHQHETNCKPLTQLQRLPVSSQRYTGEESAPGWWFYRFDPVWGPFIQQFCRQKKVTPLEFERAASQIPGLTHIEKTIAISAFQQQQKLGSMPLHTAPSFLSAI